MFKFNSKKIALMALFIALNVVVNFSAFELTFSSWKLTISITVCFFAGLFTGVIGGALTGLLGDLLGFLIMPPSFAFNPLLTLTSMFWGLIPGLIIDLYKVFFKKQINLPIGIIIIVISQLSMYLFVTLGINAFVLWKSYFTKMTFFNYLLIERLVPCTINLLANLILCIAMFCAVYKSSAFKEYLNVYKPKDKIKEQVENCNCDTANTNN